MSASFAFILNKQNYVYFCHKTEHIYQFYISYNTLEAYSGVGMCGTQEPMGSGVPGGTHPNFENMGSSGFRVPGKLGQSGFRWVPGSRSEPKKWVPVGSGFRVGTQKVGSGGFRVPTKFCFVPTPGLHFY